MVTRIKRIALPADQKFGIEFLDQITEWIADNLEPEDVFSTEELQQWAEDNSYVMEE